MGQDVTVTGVNVDTCSDVCLDSEGGFRVVFSGFTVKNSANGNLATFFNSQHVTFGPGTSSCDTTGCKLFYLKNFGGDPTTEYDIKIHNVKFVCYDPSAPCSGNVEAIGGLSISSNEFHNSKILGTNTNISGYRISDNRFWYTYAVGSAFDSIYLPGEIGTYSQNNYLENNKFISIASQAAGIHALNILQTDPNSSDTVFVSANSTRGFTNDALFNADSSNPGINPSFIFDGNSWGSNSVSQVIGGTLGTFIGRNYNASTDTTTFTGPVVSRSFTSQRTASVTLTGSPICSMGATLGSTCSIPVSWGVTFPDALYQFFCMGISGTGNYTVSGESSKSTTGVTTNAANLTSVANTATKVYCLASE